MAYWHISPWMKKIYPNIIWDKWSEEKILYLTFDDGPTPKVTEQVLDILDEYKAKSTFFCLGRNVERHPSVYAEILKRGHTIGNHTYSHLKGWKTKNKEYIADIELASHCIESKIFRPPYGQIKRSQIARLKSEYEIIMWDVMSHDYEKRVSKERSLNAILKYAKNGSILVFHDSVKAWPKLKFILPGVVEHFATKGYKFEKL